MADFDNDRKAFFDMLPGVKTFQLFHDKDKKYGKAKVFHLHEDDLPESWLMKLEDINATGMGIFMTINMTNGKGREATDVVKVRAAFADLDGVPVDPVYDYAPSMVVESSPGKFHAYWLADDIPLEGFRQVQKSIIYTFGSDKHVHDLSRVLRVPGFFHSKGERFMVRIVHKSDAKYTFRQLQEFFPPEPVKQWSAPKYQKPSEFPQGGEFRGVYGAGQGSRNHHIARRVGGMLKKGLPWWHIEQEAFKEAMACTPPLSESETRGILKSMHRYG